MNTSSDILLLITAIGVVVLVTLWSIVLWYVIKILKNIRKVSDEVVEETKRTRSRIHLLWDMLMESKIARALFKSSSRKPKGFTKDSEEKEEN